MSTLHRFIPVLPVALLVAAILLSLAGCGKSPTSPLGSAQPVSVHHSGDGGTGDTTGGGGNPVIPTGIAGGVFITDSLLQGGDPLDLRVQVTNHDATVATVHYTLSSADGWGGLPATGTFDVPAHGVADHVVHVTMPNLANTSTSAHWTIHPATGADFSGDVPVWIAAR